MRLKITILAFLIPLLISAQGKIKQYSVKTPDNKWYSYAYESVWATSCRKLINTYNNDKWAISNRGNGIFVWNDNYTPEAGFIIKDLLNGNSLPNSPTIMNPLFLRYEFRQLRTFSSVSNEQYPFPQKTMCWFLFS